MKENFRRGFEKRASIIGAIRQHGTHAAELAGLGMLSAPTVKKMVTGKPMKEKNQDRAELAGLGTLAVPSAMAIGKKLLGK